MKKLLLGILSIALFSGCKKDKCDYNECGLKAPASEIQAVQAYLASQNITNAVEHCSGLFYVVGNAGTGKRPNNCAVINVSYQGKLTNGTVFDQGTTTLSLEEVIIGWRNGIPQIQEGGRIHLYIPPTLGYGNQANGQIPANSILEFVVELNGVQ